MQKKTSWKIQNDIIVCLAEFIRKRIKDDISEYYALIAEEVTDQFSNKKILLLCLRYVTFKNGLPIIHETFFDFLHINGRPTGQTIGENILSLLEKNEIDIEQCRVYDSASATCGNSSGAPSMIKKQQPSAKHTHCRNHMPNLAIISFACKN